jgi:hypothetical protein
MAKQELAPSNNDRDIGVIESDAREAYEDAVYMAQSEWSKRDRVIQSTYLDAVQDNLHQYQTDVLAAQRAYRDATSEVFL